ncbi:MAG: heavy-metal-associated domain-containing protein [Aquirufa sp.]
MENLSILVENIKCGGCVKSIQSELLKIEGVQLAKVNIEEESILIEGDNFSKEAIIKKLSSMGYPEKGKNDLFKQAKSYVSCAIGKMS